MIRGLHLILTLILAASALAKAASLAAAPRPDSPIYLPLQIAAIIMETLLAAWLASGRAASLAHWCAVALFSLFAMVSLQQVLARSPSCGCFGALQVPPGLVLGLDLLLVALLLCRRPPYSPLGFGSRRVALPALAMGLVLLLAGAAVRLGLAGSPSHALRAEAGNHDFGEVMQQQTLTHTFTLRNPAPVALRIVQTEKTCGCTLVDPIDGMEIAPGGSLAVPVTLKTGEAQGMLTAGVTIYAKAPETALPSWVQLSITARVLADYHVTPRVMDFGKVALSETRDAIVNFQPDAEPAVKLVDLDLRHPAFSATLLPDAGKSTRILVAVRGDRLIGSGKLLATLTLRTTSKRMPTASVHLQAYCNAPMEITPRSVTIGSGLTGPVTRVVTVTTAAPSRLSARADSSLVEVECQSGQEGTRHELRLSVSQPTGQHLSCVLELKINGLHAPGPNSETAISLPVYRLLATERSSP